MSCNFQSEVNRCGECLTVYCAQTDRVSSLFDCMFSSDMPKAVKRVWTDIAYRYYVHQAALYLREHVSIYTVFVALLCRHRDVCLEWPWGRGGDECS